MISAIILAYNEEQYLEITVRTVVAAAAEANIDRLDIIIINDGSSDATHQIIGSLEKNFSFIRSIHHSSNKGPGVGVKEAVLIARYPKFIVIPGDNDLPQELLTNLFMHKDKADMVLAYYTNMQERGWFRYHLSLLYTWIYRFAFRIPVHYINSPCLYPTEELRHMSLHSDRFGFAAEMTVKLLCKGGSFHQVPGLRCMDTAASRAISWKNLREVVSVFLNLFLEINGDRRGQYRHRPQEVI